MFSLDARISGGDSSAKKKIHMTCGIVEIPREDRESQIVHFS
jgi:hypothetical protein